MRNLRDQLAENGACRDHDPEVFFPDKGDHAGARYAISICKPCPMRDACLRLATATDEWGVWGGTTREMRKERGRRAGIKRGPYNVKPKPKKALPPRMSNAPGEARARVLLTLDLISEGHDYLEIAAMLGCSRETARRYATARSYAHYRQEWRKAVAA